MQIKWNRHIVVLYGKEQEEVSLSLKHYIERNFAPCDVISIDSEGYMPAAARKIKSRWHKFCLRYARWALKLKSVNLEKAEKVRIREASKAGETTLMTRLEKTDVRADRVCNIVKRFNPEALLCAEPYALELAILARKKLKGKFRIIAEIPDFVLDTRFVRYEADNFLVENDEVRHALLKYGIPSDKILVTGLPTTGVVKADADTIRKELGIENGYPVVVVDGGEYATDTIREDVIRLMRITEKSQFNLLIVTSNQYRVRRYYMDLPEFSGGTVLFNEKFALDEIMNVADILVSVPDSVAVFTAFKHGIPVILTSALTIHEQNVFDFLVKRALVMPVKTPRETVSAVKELLLDVTRRKKFSVSGNSYAALSRGDAGHSLIALKHIDEVMRLNAPQKNTAPTDAD